MKPLPALPLMYDGDSYLLSLADNGRDILLLSISRFENNQNSDPEEVKFFSLDERGRHIVLQQITRRYGGRNVRV